MFENLKEIQDMQLVQFRGKWLMVWREDEHKGSDYLFAELTVGIANKELVDAYFETKYGKDEE